MLKNYTTVVPASRSIQEVQDALVKHGATDILYEYEPTQRVAALKFRLQMAKGKLAFALPVEWRRFQEALRAQNIRRADDEDYAYKVAWRCIRDWVLAQMALYETAIVELPQVFLPFAVDPETGKTLYNVTKDRLLLGPGQ